MENALRFHERGWFIAALEHKGIVGDIQRRADIENKMPTHKGRRHSQKQIARGRRLVFIERDISEIDFALSKSRP